MGQAPVVETSFHYGASKKLSPVVETSFTAGRELIEMILNMKSIKDKKVYAFIDANNLNLGIKSLGWKLGFHRFRIYLKEKYGA